MCIAIGKRRRKERILLVIANLALCAGIAFQYRFHFAHAEDWLDGVRGLLLGISIGINLMLLRRGRRCERAGQEFDA